MSDRKHPGWTGALLSVASAFGWWPAISGLMLGSGVVLVLNHYSWAWAVLGPAIAMFALCSLGTTIRAHMVVRQAQRILASSSDGPPGGRP